MNKIKLIKKVKTLIVIPARYASTRLPGKMLRDETGWPLIRHVYEQVKKSEADRVIVATDDQRIVDAVEQFGGEAQLTKSTHKSGTDRVAEIVGRVKGYQVIVNVQGDEPEIDPEAINKLIRLQKNYQPFMSTLCCPFANDQVEGYGSPQDANCVKVVLGKKIAPRSNAKQAIYFSRCPIPYPRSSQGTITNPENYYLHIGMFAFSPASIQKFTSLPKSFLEDIEFLEQLRAIEYGLPIFVETIARSHSGIDTIDDYRAFVSRWNQR